MRLHSARVLLALFLAAVVLLGTRLVWVAATAETGWETLGLSWYNAILGPVGLEREPIGERDPAEQAEIWLREVDRVLAAHPHNAQIAMGAAWMLDSPGNGFLQKHIKLELDSFGPFVHSEFDDEAITRASDRFEVKCAARCRELAARATELQPQNVDWWRLRALLLFRKSVYSDDDWLPRDPNWLAVLDECARHDPDNALYDYLAALRLWKASADQTWDMSLRLRILQVHNAERFAEGVARYEQGWRKRCLSIGQAASPAVAAFLRHARQPRQEEGAVAFERLASYRAEGLPIDLRPWEVARAGTREKEGDPAGALAAWRQQRQVHAQVMSSDDSLELRHSATTLFLAQSDIARLQQLAGRHPNLISGDELGALKRERESLLVDARVVTAASEQVGAIVPNRHPLDTVTPALVTTAAQRLSVLLVIAAVFGYAAARRLLRAEQSPPLGVLRHLFAWSLGWALTVFLLGICPAEALGRDVQATIIAGGTCLLAIRMLVVLFRALVARCRVWSQDLKRLPIVSLIAVITLWQATVAATSSIVQAAAGPAPLSYSQSYAQPFLDSNEVPSLPLSMLMFALFPAAVLAVLLAVLWTLFLLQHKRRTGRFPRAHFVALGLMSLSAALVFGAFALAPNYFGGHCWPPARGWKPLTCR